MAYGIPSIFEFTLFDLHVRTDWKRFLS